MTRDVRAIIVGAGFGGLSAAKALRDAGVGDITILERSADLGGVWRDNTYPGAACDVPSDLYSWSWAPHSGWRRRYGTQSEILAYIRRTAHDTGLADLIRYDSEVDRLQWDAADATWTATLADGTDLTAEVVVTAVGQLSNPRLPDVPGHETFAGPTMHTATWDHSIDFTGMRVVCVGTGASAIQAVPRIAPVASHTTVLQRTPPYVVPKPDTAYGAAAFLARRDDRVTRLARGAVFWISEVFNQALVGDRKVDDAVIKVIRATWNLHLRSSVKDPALRAALTPDYPLGCKRLLFSSEWYPTMARDDVDLVTEGVTGVEPEGVRLDDGRLVEADILVWGTGFAATDFLAGIEVVGADGTKLHEDVWDDGAWAHLGVTVPGFPNLFMIYGPNTNLGGSSIITMLESQAGYAAQVAARIVAGEAAAYEVREHVAKHYDAEMQERLTDSVWDSCTSWYNDGSRITTNWPGIVEEYVHRLAEVDDSELVAHGKPS